MPQTLSIEMKIEQWQGEEIERTTILRFVSMKLSEEKYNEIMVNVENIKRLMNGKNN